MPIQSYRDLIVWQRAMDLLTECYRVARLLPPSETYALGAHLERAAIAVAAHIASGHARERGDFLESLTVATASLREVETLLLAGTRMCLLSGEQIQIAMGLGDEVGRMLTALRRSLGAPHLQPGAAAHTAAGVGATTMETAVG
jgi:four helix bundle protein